MGTLMFADLVEMQNESEINSKSDNSNMSRLHGTCVSHFWGGAANIREKTNVDD